MLVTLQQASDHLRRDTTDDDNDLTIKIEAASQAVLNYISDDLPFMNSAGVPDYDSSGVAIDVPAPIQSAVLLILGELYKNRDGEQYNEDVSRQRLGNLIIPRAAHFLLDFYRSPICE
jgi:hypothetical protein